MRFDASEEDEIEVNMTPMIDCVFLLLIFFLVATVVKKTEKEIDVELPQASYAADVKYGGESKPVVIGVDRKGLFYIDGEPYTTSRLHSLLREVALKDKQQRIRIDGDRLAPFQSLTHILELCNFEGLKNVGIHTETKDYAKK